MSKPSSSPKTKQECASSPPRLSICPSLPPEIWIRILSYHNDLTHFWTTCRNVSPNFRAYVEQVFASYHLRDTYIDFQLEKYNLGGKSRRPEIPTTFQRFSKDKEKTIAWFKDKRAKKDVVGGGGKKADYARVMERWEENVNSAKPEMPNYTIRVGSMVNDTALPGLACNVGEREVGFEWRGMIQAFFREQERLRVLKDRWNTTTGEKLKRNHARLAAGQKIAIDDLPQSWPAVEVEHRKLIRRARLQEYYADDEEKLWAVDSLKFYEENRTSEGKSVNPLSEIPGAGFGEKWFASTFLLQSLFLDEWSCMHRIETKREAIVEVS